MEFRLNKIDPEMRQRIKEVTKSGKVHNKSEISISKDYKDGQRKGNFSQELSKYKNKNKKKRLVVEATKVEEVEVQAFKSENESSVKYNNRGSIIDVKK